MYFLLDVNERRLRHFVITVFHRVGQCLKYVRVYMRSESENYAQTLLF